MIQPKEGYYIGIDVGTGSARACLIDHHGEIVDVASENIGLWQPQQEYYVRHMFRRLQREAPGLRTLNIVG